MRTATKLGLYGLGLLAVFAAALGAGRLVGPEPVRPAGVDSGHGDLAYLHVHPDGRPGDGRTGPGPEVSFAVEVPSSGAYRLFLDFQHNGTVHTAAFTVVAGEDGGHGS